MELQGHAQRTKPTKAAKAPSQKKQAATKRSRFRGKDVRLLEAIKNYFKGKGKRVRVQGEAVRFMSKQKKSTEELSSVLSRCKVASGETVTKVALQQAVQFFEMFGPSDDEGECTDIADVCNSPTPIQLPASLAVAGDATDGRSPTPPVSPAMTVASAHESENDPLTTAPLSPTGGDQSPDSPVASEANSDDEAAPLPATQSSDSPVVSEDSSSEEGEPLTPPKVRRILELRGGLGLVQFEKTWVSLKDLPKTLVEAFKARGKHARILKRFIEDEADDAPRQPKRKRRLRKYSSGSENSL